MTFDFCFCSLIFTIYQKSIKQPFTHSLIQTIKITATKIVTSVNDGLEILNTFIENSN